MEEFFNLHSSMVRLEMIYKNLDRQEFPRFTFQYGQIRNFLFCYIIIRRNKIYIPVWLDQKFMREDYNDVFGLNLHSSMVRLEILMVKEQLYTAAKFTFQYGQIRNTSEYVRDPNMPSIYIPVWLDQKLTLSVFARPRMTIYIPVWLDQKLYLLLLVQHYFVNLHSSMVRLEISRFRSSWF